jgi:hypothetical protein
MRLQDHSIYSMLSALMVHIYHLHTALPAGVMAQRESIILCMDALESVSELWLVGKMVRDLFETVLAFDGFDLRLKHKYDKDSNQKLTGMESDLESLNVDDGSTPESPTSDKSFKFLPLTPSLVAHMDAALKSAATPSKAGHLSNSDATSSSDSLLMAQSKEEQWQHLRPLAPRSEHHREHNSMWMQYELPATPGSTGLNAAEWSVLLRSLRFMPC